MAVSQDVKEDAAGNQYVNLQDGSGNPLSSSGGALDVNISMSGSIPNAVIPAQVAQSATSVLLLAADSATRGFVIENNSTSILMIAFASSASPTAYTRRLQPNSAYEAPAWVYVGNISGIWAASGSGFAAVTQCTS